MQALHFRSSLPPRFRRSLVGPWLCAGMAACSNAPASGGVGAPMPPVGDQLFTLLPSNATGVHFENTLVETRDFNVFTYRNFDNGGGVAVGDLTGDGLPEIVLTSNQGGPRLYLNQQKF